MERMQASWLAIFLADEFHDWIDGDDPVSEYSRRDHTDLSSSVWVKFESGAEFVINIEELRNGGSG